MLFLIFNYSIWKHKTIRVCVNILFETVLVYCVNFLFSSFFPRQLFNLAWNSIGFVLLSLLLYQKCITQTHTFGFLSAKKSRCLVNSSSFSSFFIVFPVLYLIKLDNKYASVDVFVASSNCLVCIWCVFLMRMFFFSQHDYYYSSVRVCDGFVLSIATEKQHYVWISTVILDIVGFLHISNFILIFLYFYCLVNVVKFCLLRSSHAFNSIQWHSLINMKLR